MESLESSEKKEQGDEYAYLENSGFTSEKFKIEIRNLPKFYGPGELKKLLNNKLKLETNKIKFPGQRSIWVYVCFRTEEKRLNALKVLNGYKWKGNTLTAEPAKPAPDPLVKRRNENNELGRNKKFKKPDGTLIERLKDATTPLWRSSYSEQLSIKHKNIVDILKKFGKDLENVNQDLKLWVNEQKNKYDGLPCELLPIRYIEPDGSGYRNKCEFTVGINEETGERTVGFRLGSYADGTLCVGPVDEIPSVPARMKTAVNVFQNYVRQSKYDVYNHETYRGYWRQLTSRYGFRTDELMLIVGLHRQNMPADELEELKKHLIEYFSVGGGEDCKCCSLYLQYIEKQQSNTEKKFIHLWGETHIHEQLLGFSFTISPDSFFQVNTGSAEILYNSVAELSNLNSEACLLDVCCGTGTIGISLSNKCSKVLGLEVSSQAISDAKANATANNVNNAEFFIGKAEDILSSVAYKANGKEVVAIVDPPRAGLHQNAVIQLRKTKQLNSLVYVSCEPKLAVRNFIDLCRPTSKVYQREPFRPVKAVAVDMFPYTSHCELVVFFERSPEVDQASADQVSATLDTEGQAS